MRSSERFKASTASKGLKRSTVIVSDPSEKKARFTLDKEFLLYSTRKAFLEHTILELVYKFDDRYTATI